MKKSGMGLITLVATVLVMLMLAVAAVFVGVKTEFWSKTMAKSAILDLRGIQEIANRAYANQYFANLRNGIRRELTSEDIRLRMIYDGIGENEIEKYNITVEKGDVIVSSKERK